ncbi:MAG: hypothetical protein A2X11_00905 [Bacteroidetes bacterium GWE2_42_24]|nr:MAG: hypothetical protein A2X11_00905 [Bacteroidetes bacterium GWE2_42_24]OFY27480.1 MAG: hypothetical protein A2X09_07320 [Bacteroidetes bacterium GWF2_43_11]
MTLLLISAFLLPGNTTLAQTRNLGSRDNLRNKLMRLVTENWSVQVDIGPGLYYGDLSIEKKDAFSKIFNDSKLSGQLVIANKVNPWLALQGRVIYGGFSSENTQVNRQVDGSSIMIGGNIMVDFINLFSVPNEVFPDIYLYGLVGGGLVNIRTKLKNLETGEEILTNPWNRAPVNESTLYAGVGINKYLAPNWDLVFEVTFYHIKSDRFDGLQVGVYDDYFVLPAFGLKYNLSRGLLMSKKNSSYLRGRRRPLRR